MGVSPVVDAFQTSRHFPLNPDDKIMGERVPESLEA